MKKWYSESRLTLHLDRGISLSLCSANSLQSTYEWKLKRLSKKPVKLSFFIKKYLLFQTAYSAQSTSDRSE